MRLPNGYGSITYQKNNRRKPFMVRVSVNGKQKYLDSFATEDEAIQYLVSRKKDGSILDDTKLTFEQVYKMMSKEHYENLEGGTVANYQSSWTHCRELYCKGFTKVTFADMQEILNRLKREKKGYSVQKRVRQIFHNIYRYAIKYNLVAKDPTKLLEIGEHIPKYIKKPFTIKELKTIKAEADSGVLMARWIMILCLTGCRANEFLNITKKDIDLRNNTLKVRKSKTKAGENRIIPIHKAILPYIKKREWLTESKTKYSRLKAMFDRYMREHKMKHTPHECRHTFATLLHNSGVDLVSTKRILGHAVKDITLGVYTHKDIHQLKKAVNKIKISF